MRQPWLAPYRLSHLICSGSEVQIADAQAGELGDPDSGLDHERQQRVVTVAEPGAFVGRSEQRGYLVAIEVADGVALITNPGTPSRRGEEESIKEAFSDSFRIETMSLPAMLEGGDCLRVGKRLFVGKSDRTNEAGIERVREVFEPLGYEITAVPVTDVLHLKCVCSGLGSDKIVLGERTIPRKYFGDVNVVEIPNHEVYAANCVSINNTVIMANGYPEMRRKVESLGFNVLPLETSEIKKADGSLTCLSILY